MVSDVYRSLKFPSELKDFIFKELKGRYCPNPKKAPENRDGDSDKQKINMGTYFPRSFLEVHRIFEDLINNEHIKNIFENKEEFFILDIGSGTGGNLIGLLWFMKYHVQDFENKKIYVVSLDCNDIALDYQKEIIEKFFSVFLFSWDKIPGNDNEKLIEFLIRKFGVYWVKIAEIEKIDNDKTIRLTTGKRFLSLKLNYEEAKVSIEIDDGRTEEFVMKTENNKLNIYLSNNINFYSKNPKLLRDNFNEMVQSVSEDYKCWQNNYKGKFGIIMCFKFVNEFYREKQEYRENEGFYEKITETISDLLDENGLFILADTTDKNATGVFFPKLMNKEIFEYLNNHAEELRLISPLSCAFWYENCRNPSICYNLRLFKIPEQNPGSKLTYKILAHKTTAEIILELMERQDCYPCVIG